MDFYDLRIGDWVLFDGKPQEVVGLHILGGEIVSTLRPFASGSEIHPAEELESIPLTEAALDKLDFGLLPGDNVVRRFLYEKDNVRITVVHHPDDIFELHCSCGRNVTDLTKIIYSFADIQHVLADAGIRLDYTFIAAFHESQYRV